MNRVLPREAAQAVKCSNHTRFYGVGSGDVGKELARTKSVVCVSFVGGLAQKHQQETFPGCMFVPGIILRVNLCCTRCPPHIDPYTIRAYSLEQKQRYNIVICKEKYIYVVVVDLLVR